MGNRLSGIFGHGIWERTIVWGITWRDVMVCWPCSTIAFGMLRNVMRVASECGMRALPPIFVYFAFAGAIFAGSVAGTYLPKEKPRRWVGAGVRGNQSP